MSVVENTAKPRDDQKSLVKYAKPIIVSTGTRKITNKGQGKDGKNNDQDMGFSNSEDILNSILPPLEYTKGKQQLYIEQVNLLQKKCIKNLGSFNSSNKGRCYRVTKRA